MNGPNQAEGLVFYIRRVISLMLIAGLVVVTGLPIPVAIADTPIMLRESSVSQGCPIVDRDTAPARIEELKGRLAERSKAIEKTKSMLPGLESGSRDAWAKADQIMSEEPAKLMTSFASDYLKTTETMKDSITAMRKASGLSKEKLEKIDYWLEKVEELKEAGGFLDKAPTSFEAGKKFGLDHQAKTNDLFVKSGLAEELGGEFATAIGGPLGKLAFDAGLTSVNLVVATEEAFIEADAARRVQSAVDAMQWGYDRDEGEMLRLDALLKEPCNQPKEKVAESDSLPEPPPPSALEEAPVPDVPASAAAAPDMGPILLIGGAAAAAGVAGIALSGLSTTTGADCGSPPQGFGSAWWTEYSAWCRCMGGTPIVSTTQCVQ
jgi:hypothetical protein